MHLPAPPHPAKPRQPTRIPRPAPNFIPGIAPRSGPSFPWLSLVGIEADQEQIGPGEVVSVAQQRLPRDRSDRVGAAVTEVQDSRVPALAEPGIGVERGAGVSLVEGHRLDRILLQEPCEYRLPP